MKRLFAMYLMVMLRIGSVVGIKGRLRLQTFAYSLRTERRQPTRRNPPAISATLFSSECGRLSEFTSRRAVGGETFKRNSKSQWVAEKNGTREADRASTAG